MKMPKVVASSAVALILLGSALSAQAPVQTIDLARHPHLGAAQQLIVQAYQKVVEGQKANKDQLSDHAEKAKALLNEASHELSLAAEASNQRK